MLLTYFLNDCEMVPVAPIFTGITFVFTFHMRCISNVRSLYYGIFSASFLITFLSPEIAMSINIHVLFSLSWIIMSGLLLRMVLSVYTFWIHKYLLGLFLLIYVHVHTSVFCPIVPLFHCICLNVVVHSLYHVFLCTVILPVLGILICGLLSHQIFGKVCICYLSLCSIFWLHNILFVTLGLVLPLFNFQFLLLGLLSIARGMCLLY